ncbi:PTS sugar transporter subunit IIA [bacterium]|nr:PTS sugar transporter subunit IIA [bacterium]
MRISDILNESRTFFDVPGKNKQELIVNIVERAAKASNEIKNVKKFTQEVLEREALGSTGIGDEVAIPHARTENVNQLLMAFARAKEPIDFEAEDGLPVRLIFLMGVPIKELKSYLNILAKLSRVIKIQKVRDVLSQTNDPKEVIEIIKLAEDGLIT